LRFGLFRVRSPLLTESRLFSVPVGTEMFHFPTFPPTALCVQAEVAGHYSGLFRGFPIRRSPDRSSFTSSPGLIAGYNVLHRLLVPRHPPIALSSLLYYKDARVHCEVLNTRAATHPQTRRSKTCVRTENPPTHVSEPSGPNSVLRPNHHPRKLSTPNPPANRRTRLYSLRQQCLSLIVNVPQFRCPTGHRRTLQNRPT
jgi:hypothetical protein